MLNAQDGATHRGQVLLGVYYKKLIDKKYRNVIELKPQLTNDLVFCEGLKTDQQRTSAITAAGQLHYVLHSDSSGIYELEMEQGNFVTFAQLIENNPAVVATPDYIDNTVRSLMVLTEHLHNDGILHLCYAPQNVFARKSDNSPLLLCHGSSFLAMFDVASLYQEVEHFVAPEVMTGGTADERSDVFALGRFIEWLFQHGDMPIEYKRVVQKATQEDPDKRFRSVADMHAALDRNRNTKRSVVAFVAALAVVLFCVWLYFEMVPQTEDIEFVEAAPREQTDDYLDEGFNPETELGLWVDSVDTLSDEERARMDEYMRKAEDIFRRQYRREADKIMSKVYTKEGMSLSENVFIASTNAMTEELIKAQQRLAGEAGITDDVAVKIASEINDQLAAEKQKNLQLNGYQKGTHEEEPAIANQNKTTNQNKNKQQ